MNERIALTGVPETMLQTVYARARESATRGAIRDKKAEELVAKLDYDFSLAERDGAMRSGAIVKTSMVSPALMEEYFERALSAGDDVLYVGMSGGISGTAQAAAIAAGELTERYPERRIVTIDTYAASLGEGLQVLEAAEMIEEGKSLEEIKEQLLVRRPHMCQFFTVDDLAYLKRGGRISGATALIGTVLSIKPILRGDETGHIVSCGKVRGLKRAYAELANYFDTRALDKSESIGIAHADNAEGAEALLALLRDKGFTGECLNVVYEPVTGAHVGPGTVALFFYGKKEFRQATK